MARRPSRSAALLAGAGAAALLLLLLLLARGTGPAAGSGWQLLRGAPLPPRQQEGEIWSAEDVRSLVNLVVVAGHSVVSSFDGETLRAAGRDDASWRLLDYQKGCGIAQALVAHMRVGAELAAADPRALLLFSGGQTRADAGPRSEALSYLSVAEEHGWWAGGPALRLRAGLEEYARDSFENLLFSLCRFRELTGSYPATVTVVSFSFKRQRFEQLHRAAIRFPVSAFRFVGEDGPAPAMRGRLAQLASWEDHSAAAPFREDPYGCASPVLTAKRAERNPFRRTTPYIQSCPEIADLLRFCGPQPFPSGRLPWDNTSSSPRKGLLS